MALRNWENYRDSRPQTMAFSGFPIVQSGSSRVPLVGMVWLVMGSAGPMSQADPRLLRPPHSLTKVLISSLSRRDPHT